LSKKIENCCSASLYGLEIYQRILKILEFSFSKNRYIMSIMGSQLT